MTTEAERARVTLSTKTIHNPKEARHFMRLKPVPRRVRILSGNVVLAESVNATRLLETGKDVYDPVLYLPREDVICEFDKLDKQTFCPLKGHASYYSVAMLGESGEELIWSYEDTFEFAGQMRCLMAFVPARVTVEEHPLPSSSSQQMTARSNIN